AVFFGLFMVIQFFFGWAASNMNSLSMEPLGNVAGTAASVFGFTQTVGGAMIGTYIGQQYNGTLVPNAIGYGSMGALVLICVLIAENGRLFGVGAQYARRTGTGR
ncbi:MAG: MFS transporter, partial [Devosia sp.]